MSNSRANFVKVEGHRGYSKSPISGIIYYKDATTPRFSTGETAILKARKVVEKRKLEQSGETPESASRKISGVLNPIMGALWNEFLEEIQNDILPSTMGNYTKDWNIVLSKFWGDKNVSDINEANFIKFKAWYLKDFSGRYARKTIVHFKKFVKWLHKNKYLQRLPDLSGLKAVHETTEKYAQREEAGRVYTQSEVAALLLGAKMVSKHEIHNVRTYLAITLGVRCGLRKNEALKLKWKQVDLHNKKIKVWSTKNHHWRTVALLDEVVEAFKAQIPFTDTSDLVFPMSSDDDRPMSSQLLDKWWKRAKFYARIKGRARFHDLRHTFATLTAEKGWPPVVACEMLDMSLDTYQKIYCHPSDESIAKIMEKTFSD